MQNTHNKFLIVVCGPTGVGKTRLAIELAKYYTTEIISADSRQFYKEMNIGTAKPTDEQLNEVPHHFINNISIHTKHYSAGKFEHDVIAFLKQYFQKNNVAIMVGGSGLFINAVCSGFDHFDNTDLRPLFVARNFLNEKN